MPLAGGAPVLLADQQSLPHGLAVDGSFIYWLNTDGSVMKAPIAGGAWTELATGPVAQLFQSGDRGLALDADNVYWVNAATGQSDGQVLKVAKKGGKVTVLVSGEFHPVAVAVDSVNVYYTTLGWGPRDAPTATGRVLKVPVNGGAPTVIASDQSSPTALSVDASNVYWANFFGNGIMAAAIAAGAPVMLTSAPGTLKDLAVDSEHVYFVNDNVIMRVLLAGGASAALGSAPGNLAPFSIAFDCNHVYWTGATVPVVDRRNLLNSVDSDGGVLVIAK
jgi:sugar lactone lactonase YvrE